LRIPSFRKAFKTNKLYKTDHRDKSLRKRAFKGYAYPLSYDVTCGIPLKGFSLKKSQKERMKYQVREKSSPTILPLKEGVQQSRDTQRAFKG